MEGSQYELHTEEQCKPWERYLFAYSYFSDKAIAIWQGESVKRIKDKSKMPGYKQYTQWKRQKNEMAVFTLYAYADFAFPKSFDIVFELDNPANFIHTPYLLTMAVHEAWAPMDMVGCGHKHLCIFKFDNQVPDIFQILHRENQRSSTVPKGQKRLGFCNSRDFEEITARIEKRKQLQAQYGPQWWEHDDGE
jgi:hypothetical protein